MTDRFNSETTIDLPEGKTTIYRLAPLAEQGIADLDRMPYSIRVLLENVLRHNGNGVVTDDNVIAVAQWKPRREGTSEVPFMPGRAP